jgi:hypothetical protein
VLISTIQANSVIQTSSFNPANGFPFPSMNVCISFLRSTVVSTFSHGSAVEIQIINNILNFVPKRPKKFLVVKALETDKFDYSNNNDRYYPFGLLGLCTKILLVD